MSVALWLLALLSLGVAVEASSEVSSEGGTAMEGVRGLFHGLKKIFKKKHLMPALLIAYKMKALLGFVTTSMSLSALGTASALAGLFFALFAVAMCTVTDHEHRRARLFREEDQLNDDPLTLRALEAI